MRVPQEILLTVIAAAERHQSDAFRHSERESAFLVQAQSAQTAAAQSFALYESTLEFLQELSPEDYKAFMERQELRTDEDKASTWKA